MPFSATKQTPGGFSPYDDNGGSIIAIGGPDYAVIASDTRLSTGFNIYTRDQSKLFKLSNKSILGSAGCWCDTLTFTRLLNARLKIYVQEHNKEMTTSATAQMISTMMYYKRFFPYYVSNILAGLDADGSGWVYHYDPIGHMERGKFYAGGTSGALLQPFLDSELGSPNSWSKVDRIITLDKAVQVAKDVFISAAERDIYTGDALHMCIITAAGIEEKTVELRKD